MINNENDLDFIISELFSGSNKVTRKSSSMEYRGEEILGDIIESEIQPKALPIALRKRLMYIRSIA